MLQQDRSEDVGAHGRLGRVAGLDIEPAAACGAQPLGLLLVECRLQAGLNSIFDVHRAVLLDAGDELGKQPEALFGRLRGSRGGALRAQFARGRP